MREIAVSDARPYHAHKDQVIGNKLFGESIPRANAITIQLASTRDHLEDIFRFRYSVYVEEMDLPQSDADHDARRIEDVFDRDAYNFAAFQDEEVVGAIRVHFSRSSDIGYYDEFFDMGSVGHFHPQATSMCTRLMVAPRLRGTALAVRLAQVSYDFGLRNQIRFNFLDCYEQLTGFFSRLGYRIHRQADHPEYGSGNVMRLDLLDREHLIQMRSPFLPILDARVSPN